MAAPAPKEDNKAEWEAIWKKFSEILAFMYDNEHVIEALKHQKELPPHEKAEKTLNKQIDAMEHLIKNHVNDLVALTKKAAQIAGKCGKNIEAECKDLCDAIENWNIKTIQEKVKNLKEKMK